MRISPQFIARFICRPIAPSDQANCSRSNKRDTIVKGDIALQSVAALADSVSQYKLVVQVLWTPT